MSKCNVPIGKTPRGKEIPCGQEAHRYVGAKFFCAGHKAEAFLAVVKKLKHGTGVFSEDSREVNLRNDRTRSVETVTGTD